MSIVLYILLTIFAILVAIPVVILGIVSYIYVVSGYSSMYYTKKLNAKMRNNGITIKQRKIGNKDYTINTISELTIFGIRLYGHLADQLEDLQYTVEVIVDRITSFELEKFYLTQGATQSQVDAFCDNFRELGNLLANSDKINGDAINDIIKKIWDDNNEILSELRGFAKFLDRYIELHQNSLFTMHSAEGGKILDSMPDSKAEDNPPNNAN